MTNLPRLPAPSLVAALALLGGSLAACGDTARVPDAELIGPRPTIVEPARSLLPTVNVAKAVGWPAGAAPRPAAGLAVNAFATGLVHPRWLAVLPNGDVLVAESNAPPRPDDATGPKGWVMKKLMGRAGAAVPSPDRITLLRDADGDGRAEFRSVFAQGLHSPFGMALIGQRLYVAETDGVRVFELQPGQTAAAGPGTRLTELPAGTINHHWTKNIVASPDGRRLFATVGSNSNAGENGLAAEAGRAAIWEIDAGSGTKRLYATGLRNPNGMAFTPDGALWTVVNERDELGSDLVPDYLTSVADGAFYGWPYSYWGPNVDARVAEARPDLVARAAVPDYALGTHVAPLGLATLPPGPLAAALRAPVAANAASAASGAASGIAGMVIGEHGSWNREPRAGYKVVFVPFDGARPAGMPIDVLSGFIDANGAAQGRPVGVALDRRGALLVADDVGNTIWRVDAARRP